MQLRVHDVGRAERITKVSGTATYQDVVDAPPHTVAEVVAGTLHTHPRPTKRHVSAKSVTGIEIGAPFGRGKGGPGGWLIMDEPKLHLAEDIVVPEVGDRKAPPFPKHFTPCGRSGLHRREGKTPRDLSQPPCPGESIPGTDNPAAPTAVSMKRPGTNPSSGSRKGQTAESPP